MVFVLPFGFSKEPSTWKCVTQLTKDSLVQRERTLGFRGHFFDRAYYKKKYGGKVLTSASFTITSESGGVEGVLIQLVAHSEMPTHLTQDMEKSLGTQSDDTSCFIVWPSVIFCECVQTVLFLSLTSERNMLDPFLLVGYAWAKATGKKQQCMWPACPVYALLCLGFTRRVQLFFFK